MFLRKYFRVGLAAGKNLSKSNLKYLTCINRLSQKYSTSCKDTTKKNEVLVGAKQLRNLIQEHVGGRQYWAQPNWQKETKLKSVKSQDELVERCLGDSVQEMILPIGSDLNERDRYLTFFGTVRFGKLLEDLDLLAGWVGFKYYKGPQDRPHFSLVTACVDNLNLKGSTIQSNEDIKLTGFVSWAGKTSLEITIKIHQYETEQKRWKSLADSVFVMVARSMAENKGVLMNKMKTTNDKEKHYYKKGFVNRDRRIKKSTQSVFKTTPSAEERHTIHQLFLSTLDNSKSTFRHRVKPDNTRWMHKTLLKNLIICHPQSRNIYNKIFGGFLMREAFELAWANSCVYMQSRPSVVHMDDILFRKPVEVGSLLYLSSQIVYTRNNYLQTRVHAEVLDPKTGNIDTTNVFHFHFTSNKSFPQVIPSTYAEYMLYLEGKRNCPDSISKKNE